MGSHHVEVHRQISATTSGSLSIITHAIDLTQFSKFSICYLNDSSSAFTNIVIQVAHLNEVSAANDAPRWVNADTAIIPTPSALGESASVITSAIENTYKYLRVLGQQASASLPGSSAFSIVIGGFRP